MSNVKGSFYFKLTDNGNLVGEFTNNHTDLIATESGNRLTIENTFDGEYLTSWRENNRTLSAELTIESVANNTNQLKYMLTWRRNVTTIFSGEGFLVDGILIGHYTD